MKQGVTQAVHAYTSKSWSASNERHVNNNDGEKMDQEEILLPLGYLLLKRRICRRKQLETKKFTLSLNSEYHGMKNDICGV